MPLLRASPRTIALVAAGVAMVVAVTVIRVRAPSRESPSLDAMASAPELHQIELDLAVWTAAAKIDQYSAMFPAQAAALYIQRSRLTGSVADAVRAEEHARRSLANRTQHNGGSFVTLVASLLEQHRFAEAFAVARQLVIGQPDADPYHSLLGETQLELGDYEGARASFAAIKAPGSSLATMAGVARWAELQGDVASARALLRSARAKAETQAQLPRAEIAWYHMREADIELHAGRLHAAQRALDAGRALAPYDYRLLAAQGRLAAARGEWREAVQFGEASLFVVLDLSTLSMVADAYASMGDTARAGETDRVMDVALASEPRGYNRAWALYMLDRGRNIPRILEMTQRELTARRDIFTYDVAAWAAFQDGRRGEARRLMTGALRLGTRDPLLFYHAGFIARAGGDDEGAARYLTEALAMNPHSWPRYTVAAHAALDSIDATRDLRRSFAERVEARTRRMVTSIARRVS